MASATLQLAPGAAPTEARGPMQQRFYPYDYNGG